MIQINFLCVQFKTSFLNFYCIKLKKCEGLKREIDELSSDSHLRLMGWISPRRGDERDKDKKYANISSSKDNRLVLVIFSFFLNAIFEKSALFRFHWSTLYMYILLLRFWIFSVNICRYLAVVFFLLCRLL